MAKIVQIVGPQIAEGQKRADGICEYLHHESTYLYDERTPVDVYLRLHHNREPIIVAVSKDMLAWAYLGRAKEFWQREGATSVEKAVGAVALEAFLAGRWWAFALKHC